ncbi:uncharacterized protein LOC131957774 [Physella acuta]|uniref:uncharacterized protein LOC131957774 n=1 Tax=Physella acuta TaxID=109671 RepID=UPI0027DBB9F5|nr:uncharacterized protein LOC131957774 [Physella acuta]
MCEDLFSVLLSGLLVKRNYSIEVKTINREFESDLTVEKPLFVRAKAPIFKEPDEGRKIIQISNPSATTVEVYTCTKCVTDESQGRIQDLLLIVCGGNSYCYITEKKKRSANLEWKYETWSKSKKYGFSIGYRATPLQWLEQLKDAQEGYAPYTVGSNTSCSLEDNDVCNGPLPPNTKIRVFV